MRDPEVTPLGALGLGLAAGALGTSVFTLYQKAGSQLSGRGGSGGPPRRWADAPVPAKVGKRFLEGMFDRRTTLKEVPVLTQVMHWGYGIGWGAVYGLVHESLGSRPAVHGIGLGIAVTAADYAVLPAMGLYSPPWEYDAKTLATDLGSHLVYGISVAGAYMLVRRPVVHRTRARRALALLGA